MLGPSASVDDPISAISYLGDVRRLGAGRRGRLGRICLADGRGLGRCRRAIEGPAVGLVLRLNCFARGLPDFAFAIVALTWAVVTFSPPAARSMISSRGYLAPI